MTTKHAITAALIALCAVPAACAAASPKAVTFHVIASMSTYGQPQGLWEFSPQLFYSAGNETILLVNARGTVTPLFSPPSGYLLGSLPVMAANGRSYTAYSSEATVYQMSIKTTPQSVEVYPATSVGAGFIQGLPNGLLFGDGSYFTSGLSYLATGAEDGTVTPVYTFPSYQTPFSPIYASDGNYYGVAWAYEGTLSGTSYVFRVTPAGEFSQVVQLPNESFSTGNAGSFFQANDGNFYGTTTGANSANGIGTFYQVTPLGQYTLIYNFGTGANANPGNMFQASDGNFYGVTDGTTGPTSFGEIFELTKAGQYTPLYTMKGDAGVCPCVLMQASDGGLYGTANGGGKGGGGTIFVLDAGLPKPAPQALSFTPLSGAAGTKVRIWGYNLLAASVQFNGVAASSITSAGPNYVWATVPTGATTGPIAVTTPGGTSTTTASFTVP